MKKTFKQIQVFTLVAQNRIHIDTLTKKNSKFLSHLKDLLGDAETLEDGTLAIVKAKYESTIKRIKRNSASVDRDYNLITDPNNPTEYLYTGQAINDVEREIEELNNSEFEIIPSFCDSKFIPSDLNSHEKKVFTGFVLRGDPPNNVARACSAD